MRIIATYANRKIDPDVVELVCAWDEFSVDENYDGWKADRAAQLASWGDDLDRHITVEIDVDMTDVYTYLCSDLKTTATSVRVMDHPMNAAGWIVLGVAAWVTIRSIRTYVAEQRAAEARLAARMAMLDGPALWAPDSWIWAEPFADDWGMWETELQDAR